MAIVESFLCATLNERPASMMQILATKLYQHALTAQIPDAINRLLNADPLLLDDLWRFSVVLGIPHELLFESFCLQQKVVHYQKVG
jgi:hypothetical protein